MSILLFKYHALLPWWHVSRLRKTHWGLSVEFISCHRIFKRRITVLSSNFTWNNPHIFLPMREDRVLFGFTTNILSWGKSRLKTRTACWGVCSRLADQDRFLILPFSVTVEPFRISSWELWLKYVLLPFTVPFNVVVISWQLLLRYFAHITLKGKSEAFIWINKV